MDQMNASRKRSPLAFFGLTLGLSTPFWLAGALTGRQLLPGLPISALGFVCPLAAAAILVRRERGAAGVAGLLRRSFDFKRIKAKAWLAPVLLLEPAIMALSYGVIRATGVPIPVPRFSLAPALALTAGFFVAGLGEELGWSGYATDPLQERFGALGAAVLIGAVWAVWHFIPLLEAQRSPAFIAWWSLGTVALRIIIVWLYNSTGRSVFVAALYHALVNLNWQLFPVNGSYYDPRVTGLLTAAVAGIVVIGWGPQALTGRGPAVQSEPG